MHWLLRVGMTFVGAVSLLAPAASAQLYTQNFETDTTALWTVKIGGDPFPTDGYADFFFNYATVGIPPAPSGAGTHGLKLQANLFNGNFGGISVSPMGLNFTGDYVLRFDWWADFNGPFPGGGSGSTNLSTFGVGTAGTFAQWPGGGPDCVWFGATGDGGSGRDYRAYSTAAPTSYPSGDPVYVAPSHVNDNTDTYYAGFGHVPAPAAQLALFPNQTGLTAVGSAGMAWHRVKITKDNGLVTWEIDALPIATIDLSTVSLGGGNIFFGHSDINASTSSPDVNAQFLLFTLIDNVVITRPGVCGVADLALPFGQLDFSDVIAFLTAFGTMSPAADLAAPFGQWDFSDVIAFLTAFGSGCP
ncbi:MAG: GC-type dockerin domain-anchored protein [Phycisphaerales bacterium]